MSDQLTYRVVVKADEQSVKDTADRLRRVQEEADKAGKKSSGKGGREGGNTDAAKEETVAIDKLTRRYMNLTKQMSSNQQAATVYRQSLRALSKAKKDQGGLTDEQANQELALKAALADVNKDINQNKRDSVSLTQANTQLGNSYNDTKKRMAAISSELRNLQDPLGKNQEQATALSTEYNKLNNRLKTVDKSMGNHQRNVGNYENSIRGAANAVAVFQGPLGPLAGRINSAATVLSRMAARADAAKTAVKEKTGAMGVFQRVLSGNIKLMDTSTAATTRSAMAMRVANIGVLTLNKSLKLLRLAIIGTGIGALAIAVAGLFNWFTKTEAGAQRLRVIMAQLGAVLSTVQERSIEVGRRLSKVFTDPKQAVLDLWDAIKTNLLNRVQAVPELLTNMFGVITKGGEAAALAIKGIWDSDARERSKELFKEAGKDLLEFADSAQKIATGIDMGDTFGGLAGEIADNVKQAGELEHALNAVKERERELGVERARTNAQLQEARDIANDTTNSFDERLKAINEAEQAENALLEQEMANEQERLRIVSEQDGMFSSREEQLQAVADQEAKVQQMRQDAARRSLRLTRDRERVERQLSETILRGLRREIATIERRNELDLKARENQLLEEGRALDIAEERLDNFNDVYAQRLAARTMALKKELENQNFQGDAANEARLQAEQELQSERLDLEQDVNEKRRKRRIAQENLAVNEELRAIDRRYESEIFRAQETSDRIAEIELQRKQKQEEFAATRDQRLQKRTRELIDGGLEDEEAATEARIQIAEEESDALLEIDRKLRNEKRRREDAEIRWRANSQLRELNARMDEEMSMLERRNDRVGQLEREREAIRERQRIEGDRRVGDLQEQFIGQGFDRDVALIRATNQVREENEIELAENQRAIDEAVYENRVAIAEATVNFVEKANSALFGNNKVVSAATALVNTYLGVTKALASSAPPLNFINAAAVAAAGIANVRKILSTDEKGGSGGKPETPKAPSASFGLVDVDENQNALANAVAGNTGGADKEMNPTIILDGEFDPEALSIKVRQGNHAISGRTLNTGS